MKSKRGEGNERVEKLGKRKGKDRRKDVKFGRKEGRGKSEGGGR